MPKSDLAGTSGAATTVVDSPTKKFQQRLLELADLNSANRSFDVASSQLDRMLMETETDAIMDSDEFGTHQCRDVVGLEVRIHPQDFDRQIFPSDEKYNAPLKVYIQIHATALTARIERGIAIGDELLLSTGAPLIIGKVMTMNAARKLPFDFKITGYDAPNGTVLKLRPAERRSVEVSTGA